MRIGLTEDGLRDLHALWDGASVALRTDAELVERFASRRSVAAESAFAALVGRHGPMVLATCRRALGDRHEADDAFQATFLVLVRRAGSLRVGESLGPWLHEVARRVSLEARASAIRRRRRVDPDADPAAVAAPGEGPGGDDLRALIDEELARLPGNFREAVVLCDLEGLTIEAAARRLGWPFGTVKSRLARGRDRLRDRLRRRGLAPTAGIAPIPVPPALLDSTVGFLAGNAPPAAAAVLAAGVLKAMILRKLTRVLALTTLLGAVGAGVLMARPADEPEKPEAVAAAQAPSRRDEPKPAPSYRITGTVRVEGTGEPVGGATLDVLVRDSGPDHLGDMRHVATGPDGRFVLDIPPGQARAWVPYAPVGFWVPNGLKAIESFVVTPAAPVFRKDYTVRRGAVWTFRVAQGPADAPSRGASLRASWPEAQPETVLRAESDADGLARLTLPTGAGKLSVNIAGKAARTGVSIPLEWAAGFRPEAVKGMERRGGDDRLNDADGRVAVVGASKVVGYGGQGRAEPTIVDGALVIRVRLPEPDPKTLGDLAGRVVDEAGRPIAGARVALIFREEHGGSGMSPDDRHQVMTDAQGRYLLRAIPRKYPSGGPIKLGLAVTKQGRAGVDVFREDGTGIDSFGIPFRPGDGDRPQVLKDIRMEPGVSLTGVVVGPDGVPAPGVWVSSGSSYALRSQGTRTDEQGRFTFHDLPRGMASLTFDYGKLYAQGKYLVDGTPEELKIQLKPIPARDAKSAPAPTRPEGLAIGTPAPEWSVTGWTDGKPRSLADFRGKVVYLDFWGDWCGPCVQELPGLDRLRRKYEPRGVAFVSIHTPGGDPEKIRRLFGLKKVDLISAIDEPREPGGDDRNGVTAERYQVGGYPTMVLIDREGKVAFPTGQRIKEKVEEMKALGASMGLAEATMTLEQFDRLREAFFSREIERVLGPR